MKAYLDSEDSYYYRYNEESVKEELINVKVNRDYAGIGAVIFIFTVMSIVIGLGRLIGFSLGGELISRALARIILIILFSNSIIASIVFWILFKMRFESK
jgi:mannose/fructose/N-acetylgalactosamine-specific phosphotransferase system component IID